MGRTVKIVEYDPAWVGTYDHEASIIRKGLNTLLVECFHIGSTAIPGMPAKPIIDILLSVKNILDLDTYSDNLNRLGYECLGEYGIKGRRFFQKGGDHRTHHIHAFDVDSPEIERHVLFRDYLREFAEEAKIYAELKKELASVHRDNPDDYSEAKNRFIRSIEEKARHWYLQN